MPIQSDDPGWVDDLLLTVRAEGHTDLTVSIMVDGHEIEDPSNSGYSEAQAMKSDWLDGSLEENERPKFFSSLGTSLFPSRILEAVNDRYRDLNEDGRLRLWLRFQGKQHLVLMGLPWEAAQNSRLGKGVCLALDPKISVFRCWDDAPRSPSGPISGPLHISMLHGPGRGPELTDLREVTRKLQGECGDRAPVDFDYQPATKKTWEEAAKTSHIVHFSGHGTVVGKEQKLVLQHDDDGTSTVEVPINQIRLPPRTGPLRLIVLAACSTAEIGATPRSSWVQFGSEFVVAMQRQVEDISINKAFTPAFYKELVSSGDLDRAMALGRDAAGDGGVRAENFSPVIYGRYEPNRGRILFTMEEPERSGPTRPASTLTSSSQVSKLASRPQIRRDPEFSVTWDLHHYLEEEFFSAVRDVEDHVRSITPFLGPGVLQIDPECERIKWDAALDDAGSEDKDLGLFLNALLSGTGVVVESSRMGNARGRTVVRVRDDSELGCSVSKVRIALARLAMTATVEFAGSVAGPWVPMGIWESHAMDGSGLVESLDRAIAELAEHATTFGRATVGLGIERMQSRLKELRRTIVEDRRGIPGSTVAWLTDLFWHAVIFDSPLYPRLDELSIQISLLAGRPSGPVRRLEPTGAVHRDGLAEVAKAAQISVARGFDPAEDPLSGRRRFNRALGLLLRTQYDEWSRRPTGGSLGAMPAAPLVISSNFDLELERGLAALGRFHVALPVYVGVISNSASTRGEATILDESVRWIIGTFGLLGDSPDIDQLSTPENGWRWLTSLETPTGTLDLAGPIVLKVNGSPLHAISKRMTSGHLGDARDSGNAADLLSVAYEERTEIHVEHAIALGEYDFLQLARLTQWSFDRDISRIGAVQAGSVGSPPEDGLPAWVVEEIRDSRRFWILMGQRFAEWSTRSQLHTFLSHDAAGARRGCAISRGFDEDRLRFLHWFGITRARGEAAEMTQVFERLAAMCSESEVES